MSEAIVITPVKDSPGTAEETIRAICNSEGDFKYYVFNDFSKTETKRVLESTQKQFGFHLIHLEDITNKPSPNYKLVLERSQQIALDNRLPLIIVESDVVVEKETFLKLLELNNSKPDPGLIGAITIDKNGNYNFPYNYEKPKKNEVINTRRSLSFCCTLLSYQFLKTTDFKNLSEKKDWYDLTISRQSKKSGFNNYLAKNIEVLHSPHSSRPWKQLKYTNLPLYYLKKIINRRDRI
ncbi:MAG: glycosyltransferase [Prolixibacteraceae bacterium]|nr:glycosyltransferase [Prolixibacteraceae bacterium]